jgi:hypothetical protein
VAEVTAARSPAGNLMMLFRIPGLTPDAAPSTETSDRADSGSRSIGVFRSRSMFFIDMGGC